MFTENQIQQLRIDFNFVNTRLASERKSTAFSADLQVIADRATSYGALIPGSYTAWVRAISELAAEKEIRLKKPIALPVPIPADFEQQVNTMSSGQLRERLKDKNFGDLYGRWAAGEKPEGATEFGEPEVTLTREQYFSIPAAIVSRRYTTSPAFRVAVDALFDRGEVRRTNISGGSR